MKYSIIIPAYKSTFLSECIESILAQTFPDFELIIVDDASPHNIKKIVDNFQDKRIRFYRNPKNFGAIKLVDNWNHCLSYAQGEFTICMGDDDKLLPHCLETYNRLIDKYPDLDIYHGRTEFINDNSEFLSIQEARPEFESALSLIWHRWHGRLQMIGDFLYRTNTLKKYKGFYNLPMAWCSDDISSYRAAKDKGIANTQTIVFQYRRNAQTISNNSNNMHVKIQAVLKEKQYLQNFLLHYKSINNIDEYYMKMLKNELPDHYNKHIRGLLVTDINNRTLSRTWYWLKNKKTFDLSYKQILSAVVLSLLMRF